MLSKSFPQDYPLSFMQSFLALEAFLCKLRVNTVLREITISSLTNSVIYAAYSDDVSMLVMSSVDILAISKDIKLYETVAGLKINCDKSIGLQLVS